MANKDDYLTEYRQFFETFAQTVNPNDQLPVKLASYKFVNLEVVGGIIDWTTQYLTQKKCPQSLVAPLIKIIIDEIRKACKKHPLACGFNPADNAYEPLKLMQTVMAKTNEVCLRYLDNSILCSLPSPGPPYNIVSVCAVKNTRRRMEDRHVVIHDLNTLFNIQEASPSSYYAIFDGHAGHDAAAYSAAHLHQYLAESRHFISNPEKALQDAFCKTDSLFIDKCKVEHFSSGTTAVCALLKPKEKSLYIAWVGDSQALLVNQGKILQCVEPHKPSRQDEKNRIEQEGGTVLFWGTWRVNGQLAVSRAIGDHEYKPYVTAIPDIREIPLDGNEDFLIIACDGLWDFLSEDDAARAVYNLVCENPDKTDYISQRLVELSKQRGSSDNISVIVVFLREPSKISAEAHWANRNCSTMDASLDNANAANNPFVNSNGSDILSQKENFMLNLNEAYKQNGSEKCDEADEYFMERSNGKRSASELDDDDDLGPETDVDIVDDVLPSSIAAAKALAEGIVPLNPAAGFNPFEDHVPEKAALEIDLDIQEKQNNELDIDMSPREETPTPPADAAHDVSGLVDNVAESGDDSEDEWNYFKGDTAQKEEPIITSDSEVADITGGDASDTMSQLNPNAAEFVPVSPTRGISSPVCQMLINDAIISQSPSRVTPSDVDLKDPNPQEFDKEIKSRPSEVGQFNNGHDKANGDHLSTEEIMKNFLNDKNIDDIDFQPLSSPPDKVASNEFHFGPNATPFTPSSNVLDQSEGLSTKAVFGDESSTNITSSFVSFSDSNTSAFITSNNKSQDPMSMSIYEDKNDEDPLNTVQVLPDNFDEFIINNKNSTECSNNSLNDTISDLPEHNPLETKAEVDEKEVKLIPDSLEDLSDFMKSDSVEQPVNTAVEALIASLSSPETISPQPREDMLISPQPCEDLLGSPQPREDLLVSPQPREDLLVSPQPQDVPISSPHPQQDILSPQLHDNLISPEPHENVPLSPKLHEEIQMSDQFQENSPCTDLTTKFSSLSLEDMKNIDKLPSPVPTTEPSAPSPELFEPNVQQGEKIFEMEIPSPERVSIGAESTVTADVNSFLDRSDVPNVASPLSADEQFDEERFLDDMRNDPLSRCVYPLPNNFDTKNIDVDIKTDTIKPDFPIETVTSPSEDSKCDEFEQRAFSPVTSESAPVVLEINEPVEFENIHVESQQETKTIECETKIIGSIQEETKIEPVELEIKTSVTENVEVIHDIPIERPESVEKLQVLAPITIPPEDSKEKVPQELAVGAGVVAAAAATAAAVTTVVKKNVKSKTTTTCKKPSTKPLSPTKGTTSKPPPIRLSKTSTTTGTKTTITKTTPSPKPPPITKTIAAKLKPSTTTRITEKVHANGDVAKPLVRSTLTAKKVPETSTTKPPLKTSISATKTNPTKTSPRPASSLTKPKPTTQKSGTTALSPRTTTTRPASTTSSRLMSNVSTTKTTSLSNKTTATSPRTTATTTSAKPRPATTTVPKARVPLTKTITKGPDAVKQIKENANKQITASRTTASARNITSATKKTTEVKTTGSTRTATTKTTVTNLKSCGIKKTNEVTSKTKTSTTKPQQNGISMVETITTTVVSQTNSTEPRLVKDNSPVDIIDNNMIIDNTQIQANIAD